jgi:hypothetical protein
MVQALFLTTIMAVQLKATQCGRTATLYLMADLVLLWR